MGNLHLVTGYAGEAHITSADQGSFNAALLGNGEFVLERGKQFAASIITNNQVRVLDGDLLMQGRHIRMKENTFADLYFDNGTQGYKRIDLIVARYTKDSTTDIESAELVVIKGTPSESNAVAPAHITGDIINEQALQNDVVLYQVPFDGINMQELVKVFSTVETLETLKKQLMADVEEKLKDVEILIISDVEEMKLIDIYGKYTADAKIVGETFASQVLTFIDITVTTSEWGESGRSDDYLYKATISCAGVTASYMPNVAFSIEDAVSGNFAPCATSANGVVMIWAKKIPESDITIPTIQCIKSV